MQLTACLTTRGPCTIVTLGGYVDVTTRQQLHDILAAASKGTPYLIIDLHKLGFMGGAGLNVFAGIVKQMHANGGTLALACPQPIIVKMLEISGLDRKMTVDGSLEAALARAAGSAVPVTVADP
jgi:anti-anti-sigma factor